VIRYTTEIRKKELCDLKNYFLSFLLALISDKPKAIPKRTVIKPAKYGIKSTIF